MSHAIHYIGVEVFCGQEDCPQSFTNFRSLTVHLETKHAHCIGSCSKSSIVTNKDTVMDVDEDYETSTSGAIAHIEAPNNVPKNLTRL